MGPSNIGKELDRCLDCPICVWNRSWSCTTHLERDNILCTVPYS